MVGRVGKILLGLGEMQPQRLLRCLQLVGGEEALDEGEPVFAHLLESAVRYPHSSAQ